MFKAPHFEPGTIILFEAQPGDEREYRFYAIVGSNKADDDKVPLVAIMHDDDHRTDPPRWHEHHHPELFENDVTVVTGDEADKLWAMYCAQQLTGD